MTDEAIRASIALYNENRRLVREVYAFRARTPWKTPAAEVYLLMRAGMVLPVEEHDRMLRDVPGGRRGRGPADARQSRVVVTGAFCEQPPLNLIKSIELAGCYIVDDDFLLVNRWEKSDVPRRATRSPRWPAPICTTRSTCRRNTSPTRRGRACIWSRR